MGSTPCRSFRRVLTSTLSTLTNTPGPGTAIGLEVDVSSVEAVKDMVRKARRQDMPHYPPQHGFTRDQTTTGATPRLQVDTAGSQFGRLDILFNNAGLMHGQDDDAISTEVGGELMHLHFQNE